MYLALDPSIVTDNITKAYQSFYDKIDFVNSVVSTSPDNYTQFWGVVTKVSDSVKAVGISLACIYGLVSFIKDGINLRGNWEGIIKCLIKLIIAKGLIENSTDILLAIYKIAATASKSIEGVTGSMLSDNLKATIADSPTGFWDILFSYIKYLPFELTLWVLGILIVLIALGRLMQIFLFTMFAPIGFSQFAGSGIHGIRNFLKDYFAVCLQGAMIMGAMDLFSVLLSHQDVFSGLGNDVFIGDLGLTIIYSAVLIKVLISSQNWSRKILS